MSPGRSSGGKQDTTVSDTVVPDESGLIGGKSLYARIVDGLTVLFPVWVLVGATIGIVRPETVTWFSKDMFTMGLSFLMLSMGLTLTWKDFQEASRAEDEQKRLQMLLSLCLFASNGSWARR